MAHLHTLSPETANCTIVIPVPRRDSHPSTSPKFPDADSAPCIALRLHRPYLAAKSLLLRGLFSGASPTDIIQHIWTARLPSPSAPLHVPQSRLPRLLPSPPTHPVIFLPVPDPSSIQPLFHWMYFGNTDHIEIALDRGDIQWEGLARNVEHLALSTDIKVFLGRWYRSWYLPARCSPCPADEGRDESDESDLGSDCDSSDSDAFYSSPATLSSDDDDDDERIESDEECDRGRTRDIKPLVRLCGQLRLCTA